MDDLISRQAVLDLPRLKSFNAWGDVIYESVDVEDVRQLPSVKSQTGHWIYDDIVNNWRCDKCGETPKTMGYVGTKKFMEEHFKFCNHCGARMIKTQGREG